mmetsp:Transcript_10694/g.18896  ORF Transcript_10694/g.18896 Transcript_10694/m.18896 type:complete len:340 (-) Transcript_10694:169-1188(-)
MGLLLPTSLEGASPVMHGLYGTLFTWFVTALGAGLVFLIPDGLSESTEGKLLDAGLGAAAGIMLAASFWSLLAPAIELAEDLGYGDWSFAPAAAGFLAGSVFVFLADWMLPEAADSPEAYLKEIEAARAAEKDTETFGQNSTTQVARSQSSTIRKRKGVPVTPASPSSNREENLAEAVAQAKAKAKSWRRLVLLVIAVTIHNFPEGLAVGVGFGAVGVHPKATLKAAEVLTFGIGIQNFPEGLAVSLPMRRMGYSRWWCFFYGQLSGMVEPLGGLLGAAAVQVAEPILPFALSFAAGAMVYVVVDSIVPEAQTRGNSKVSTWGAIVGFLVMMTLDVALG